MAREHHVQVVARVHEVNLLFSLPSAPPPPPQTPETSSLPLTSLHLPIPCSPATHIPDARPSRAASIPALALSSWPAHPAAAGLCSNGLEMPLIGLGTWQAPKGQVGAAVETALNVTSHSRNAPALDL